tara:strand:+ start:3515 stop:3907 length:393 start_codon:yes stop_codon:yes gene_type:complete
MRTLISKFISRLAFVGLAIILLPLAVQNRQIISLTLDPMALLSGTQASPYQVPLFVALLLVLVLGLMCGYGLARLSQSRLFGAKKAAKSVDLATSSPLLNPDPVLKNAEFAAKGPPALVRPAKEEKANGK